MKKTLLLTTSLLIASAYAADACSCLRSTPEEHFERSSVVFAGRVIDVDEQNSDATDPSSSSEQKRVVFEVSKVWKGKNQRRLVVMTSDSSASCGYSFQEREEYLVYASSQDAELQTGLCSGTKPLSEAQADLSVLGEGQAPGGNSSIIQQLRRNQRLWAAQNITNYHYTLRLSCFCLTEVTQPVIVEVRNGKVTSIVAADSGKPVNSEYFEKYDSIAKLFDVVRDAIANDAHSLSVSYHPTLHYPTQINIDYDSQMADEERFLTIENLAAID